MDKFRPPTAGFVSRPEVRLASFGLAAVSAVYLGFLGVEVGPAEAFLKRGGYYVMLLSFLLWAASLMRLWRRRTNREPAWPRHEWVAAGMVVLLFTTVAITQETFRSKVLYDEFVLQSTAFNMHFFRDVVAMVRGYDILGTFVSTDNYLDKRPYFYPFMVSLVHDLTGYRTANAYGLNAMLMPVTLGLAYFVGRGLTGWRGGMLAIGLLGTLPLFALNATGSGMELLNLAMLLTAVALAAAYLAQPDDARLSAFVLTVVLLAQCRYESVLYVLPAALIVLAGWWRTGRITLSWMTVAVPLLLVPVALHNKVLSHSPVLWEMKANQTSRFGLEHVAGNLRSAVEFFCSPLPKHANSQWLSLLGGAALVWVLGRLIVRRFSLARAEPQRLAWFFMGCGIVTNTGLVMFYFWSAFTDPLAARFSLPLYLLSVYAAVMLAGWLDRRLPATPILLFLTAGYFLCFSIPKQAQHEYSNASNAEVEWERRFVAARPPGVRLIVSNKSTLPWLLQKIPSIQLDRIHLVTDRLRYQLEERTFCEILVTQSLRPTSREGGHQLVPDEALPAGYVLETVAEKRFGTKLARISRLVAVGEPPKIP